uniref:Uncharacterized protein n=1 Tax=Panagrolaimus sp. ES5 TaxID=591445 RepID=A0AC34GN91_9BILA
MHVYTHATTPELATLNDAMPSTSMVVDMADCMPSTSEAAEYGINDDDKSSVTSTPPLGFSMDEKAAEKRPATLYARLNKKVQSVYGKATRTALNNALKPTQDAFYKMTGKPTAFKAAQFAPKYWKNQVFNNGIPAIFTARTFPMNTYDRNITDPASCYNGSLKNVTEQLEESCGSSNQFISTVKSLNGYIQKVAEAEVANSPSFVPTSALTKGLQIKKAGHFKTNALHQMMTKISSGGAYHADQRAFICASVLDSYSNNPISAKKPPTPVPVVEIQEEGEVVIPSTETMEAEKTNKKRRQESKDDKENMPTKLKRRDGFDTHKNHKKRSKHEMRKNGKIKILHKKHNGDMNFRKKRIVRKTTEAELYKNENSVRVSGELCGEKATARDLEYLKDRKLNVKTARRKPKPDFGIFCEATWFRKQLLHKTRDYPIPLDENDDTIQNGVNGAKRKRRGSNMQDRAAQFVYAHILTPEEFNIQPTPFAPPINIDPCNNYDEIYAEYEQYVKKSHQMHSKKEDFHWKEYEKEKLEQVPNKFRNVEDRLGINQVLSRYIKTEIKEEIKDIDEEMNLYALPQEKMLFDD